MYRRERSDALELDHERTLDDQVHEVLADDDVLVDDRDANLPFVCDATPVELDAHRCFVDRLHETRPKTSMNLDAGAYRQPGDVIDLIGRFGGFGGFGRFGGFGEFGERSRLGWFSPVENIGIEMR
jgi:hypothetical protein